MNTGEIYFGINNQEGGHPIVFLNERGKYTFDGLMLTHSEGRNNVKLLPEHFEYVDDDFDISKTHVVRRRLIKSTEWKPFVKKGKLSQTGLDFVSGLIEGQEATIW